MCLNSIVNVHRENDSIVNVLREMISIIEHTEPSSPANPVKKSGGGGGSEGERENAVIPKHTTKKVSIAGYCASDHYIIHICIYYKNKTKIKSAKRDKVPFCTSDNLC